MTIDEAIKYCEEVAHQNEILMNRYDDASGYSRSHDEKIRTSGAKGCEQLISLYRQLAEWLKELRVKRQIITNVKEQCKVWKRNDFQNRDYGIGFISALSNIEGLIAYTEEQLEVNADDT